MKVSLPLDKLRHFLEKLPLFLAPLYPLAFLAGNAATEMAVLFTVLCFLGRLYFTKDFSFLKEKWLQITCVFIVYLLARNVFLSDPSKALSLICHTFEFILFVLALAYWVLKTETAHRRLLMSTGLVLVFVILDSFYQFFHGVDIFGLKAKMEMRLTGPFKYMRVGAFISFLMFPVVTVFLDKLWRKYNVWWAHLLGLVLFGVILLILLLSGERVTLIYFAVGYLVLLFFWRRHQVPLLRISLVVSLSLLAAILGFAVLKLKAPQYLEPLEQTGIYQSIKTRMLEGSVDLATQGEGSHYGQIWSRAYTMFLTAPLFGVGVHQFDRLCPEALYGPTDNLYRRCSNHIHHYYLELLTETGIVGFSLMVTVFLILLTKIWATRSRWDEVPLLLGLFAAYVISIWPLAPFRGFFQAWRGVMFWFVVGWMLAAINTYGRKKNA